MIKRFAHLCKQGRFRRSIRLSGRQIEHDACFTGKRLAKLWKLLHPFHIRLSQELDAKRHLPDHLRKFLLRTDALTNQGRAVVLVADLAGQEEQPVWRQA